MSACQHVCVCLCICERERERLRGREGERERGVGGGQMRVRGEREGGMSTLCLREMDSIEEMEQRANASYFW